MLGLRDIADTPLPAGTKGLPLDGSIARPADLVDRGLNVLRGDFPMPVAVLKRSALDNNLRVMQDYIGVPGSNSPRTPRPPCVRSCLPGNSTMAAGGCQWRP